MCFPTTGLEFSSSQFLGETKSEGRAGMSGNVTDIDASCSVHRTSQPEDYLRFFFFWFVVTVIIIFFFGRGTKRQFSYLPLWRLEGGGREEKAPLPFVGYRAPR